MQRLPSLDLARGFTVLCMTPVHAVLLFSLPALHSTLPVQLLGFIAEGPGAQLFLVCMGISFTYSRHTSGWAVAKRAGYLLIAGYALNAYKFVLPFLAGWLPPDLQAELAGPGNTPNVLTLLGTAPYRSP